MPVRHFSFFAIIGLVLVVRVSTLTLPGMSDVVAWKVWTYNASQHLLGVYGIGGSPPERAMLHYGDQYMTVDYPPVALAEMSVVGVVYRALYPDFPNDTRLVVAVKLPGLAAGLALTLLLYWSVRRLSGSTGAAQFAALAFWANPATILNAEVLGYLDPLLMLPAIMSLVCLHLRRPMLAGALLALAMLTKPQGLLVGPAFLVAAWHTGGRTQLLRGVGACAATAALCVLPWVVVGALPNMWLAFGSWTVRRNILSGNAANVWWVATWIERAYNMIPLFGFPAAYLHPVRRILSITAWMENGLPNPRPIGFTMVTLGTLWGLWRGWRRSDLAAHAALAAFTVQVFFTLGVSVHEHHMMLAVPLLVLAAALDPAYRWLMVAVSLFNALNINIFYGIGLPGVWTVPRTITPIDFSVVLALCSVPLLLWHARILRSRAALASRG